ncbi:uncharacterized protein BO97DRAFT_241606 [Aspergillus homomorphus CBS 101889]|uniref:Uncharacterized protein n=1 Tax=Aspergillus homomorphus (strain CBS 101889) TaxID=1450537 RepID=A0A395I653_ASPHC|nr:hypothetical protein BO97DRAFT_241606 [Aspergillus homomorphus CBS 101889]RAL15275.1 hypothetical protein BO97DRAFT_241606 [Aspergillus homomorphus CBS 101889]
MDPLRDGHGKALHSENSAILIFGAMMSSRIECRRKKTKEFSNPEPRSSVSDLFSCADGMKIMSQATCGEATRHARVSEGHALGIQSGDG